MAHLVFQRKLRGLLLLITISTVSIVAIIGDFRAITIVLVLSLEAIKFETSLLGSRSVITGLTRAYDNGLRFLSWSRSSIVIGLVLLSIKGLCLGGGLAAPRVEVKLGRLFSIIRVGIVVLAMMLIRSWFFIIIVILITKYIFFGRGNICPPTFSTIYRLGLVLSPPELLRFLIAAAVASRHRIHAIATAKYHRPSWLLVLNWSWLTIVLLISIAEVEASRLRSRGCCSILLSTTILPRRESLLLLFALFSRGIKDERILGLFSCVDVSKADIVYP